MIKFYLYIISGVFIVNSYSQHFSFDPTDYYEATVPDHEYTSHIVFIDNLTGGELTLGWERLNLDFPQEWTADLCDYVGCYMGIPESGTMLPLSDTARGYLKISLHPNNFLGTGMVTFRVFDTKHPEFADTLTFVLHSVKVTSVAEKAEEQIILYPTPAAEQLFLKNIGENAANVIIYNSSGEIIFNRRLEANRKVSFQVSGLASGFYMLHYNAAGGLYGKKKIIIN